MSPTHPTAARVSRLFSTTCAEAMHALIKTIAPKIWGRTALTDSFIVTVCDLCIVYPFSLYTCFAKRILSKVMIEIVIVLRARVKKARNTMSLPIFIIVSHKLLRSPVCL